ncbi:MAG TPA: outer membrane protein transport protein [Candidatus Heimdallarchaeota archaeon]|nr:outer membrane protein transport protein [Candidatus Heimdallarchaeota archaeon]
MLKKTFILLLVVVLSMSTGYLSATVLTLYNVGPKAATMAGAFVGRADNTTAIFYNPAGLAFQKSLGFSVNVNYYNYTVEAGSEKLQRTDQSSEPQLIGSLYVAYTYKERISIGVGAYTPYSLVTKWPSQWPGDPLCVNSELNVFTIRPVLAIKINKYLSIGAGLDIIHSSVRWDFHNIHSVAWGPDEEWIINELNASGNGIGFTAGVLFKPSDNFQIGGRYQKKVDLDLKGKNDYDRGHLYLFNHDAPEHTPEVGIPEPEFAPYQEVIFSLPLPSEIVVGIMLAPAKRFTIQADVQRTGWSSFKIWEFVAADPEDSIFPEPTEDEDMNDEPVEGAREGIELNMKDTWSFKLGGEYYLKEELSLRIGYARHQSPFDDKDLTPVLPLLPRNVVSFGVGYDGPARSIATQSLIGNITFDAYVQYVMLEERTSSYPGYPLTFVGNYWVFGFGVGFYL